MDRVEKRVYVRTERLDSISTFSMRRMGDVQVTIKTSVSEEDSERGFDKRTVPNGKADLEKVNAEECSPFTAVNRAGSQARVFRIRGQVEVENQKPGCSRQPGRLKA